MSATHFIEYDQAKTAFSKNRIVYWLPTNYLNCCIVAILIALLSWLSSTPNLVLADTAPQSLLEMSLTQAQRTEFFTFFYLSETGRQLNSHKRTVVTFKPDAEAFRRLVIVQATLGSRDRIIQMDLLLARSFIEDREQRVYASDIAKSMIHDTVPYEDRSEVEMLVREIEFNRGANMNRIATITDIEKNGNANKSKAITASRPRETPSEASPGYLTYRGKQNVYEQKLRSGQLYMRNITLNNEDWVQIQIFLKP